MDHPVPLHRNLQWPVDVVKDCPGRDGSEELPPQAQIDPVTLTIE